MREYPCDFHCGYMDDNLDDYEDHVRWEHVPCAECGTGGEQDLEVYSVSHKLDCPRLQPGYTYPVSVPGQKHNRPAGGLVIFNGTLGPALCLSRIEPDAAAAARHAGPCGCRYREGHLGEHVCTGCGRLWASTRPAVSDLTKNTAERGQ